MLRSDGERVWQCRDKRIPLGRRTVIMGIVNVTPDSFFDGGQYHRPQQAVDHALQLVDEGADIIDIGGESSRPGAMPVTEAEELRRVIPVVEALSGHTAALLSVDTTKSSVARRALEAGAHIVNDISAGRADPMILSCAASMQAGLVLMHMQGEPQTMQANPVYADVVADVRAFLKERWAAACAAGVDTASIALDPGIGFGKTFDHNWQLLARLGAFADLSAPLLVGLSRKRFLGALCGDRTVDERLPASLAALTAAIVLNGADIIRVHDVKESCDAARVADRIRAELRATAP